MTAREEPHAAVSRIRSNYRANIEQIRGDYFSRIDAADKQRDDELGAAWKYFEEQQAKELES